MIDTRMITRHELIPWRHSARSRALIWLNASATNSARNVSLPRNNFSKHLFPPENVTDVNTRKFQRRREWMIVRFDQSRVILPIPRRIARRLRPIKRQRHEDARWRQRWRLTARGVRRVTLVVAIDSFAIRALESRAFGRRAPRLTLASLLFTTRTIHTIRTQTGYVRSRKL